MSEAMLGVIGLGQALALLLLVLIIYKLGRMERRMILTKWAVAVGLHGDSKRL